MAFYKSKFTGEEIDQRLAQGTFDDAIKAGFTGTKEQFDQLLAKIQETTNAAEAAQPAESDELETVNKNIVDAINEIQIEVNTKQPIGDYATKTELTEETTARQTEDSAIRNAMIGKKTEQGGEVFNDYENNAAGASYAHAEGQRTIATGNSSHAEGVGTKATNANSHSEGNQTTASGSSSHAEGYSTTASGGYSHAEGNGTQATANAAHAEGTNTVASANNAHAEGQNNTADAAQAHAEGGNNTAHGQNSHAEGNGNTANGGSSHVEGYDNTAEGSYCHVEGGHNTASGNGSHAEGIGTQAINEGEHAEGRYNMSNNGGTNASRTVHSVGVGSSSAKRNAHEIMWNGDHYVYGLGGYDGTNYADAQTLQEVIDGKQGSTDNTLQTTSKTITGAINEIKESVESISDPYEINLTNLLSAEDSESISTAIGGIDNLNAIVQNNRIIVGTISNGSVSVSIRILGNVTTLYYLLDSVVGLTLNEVAITNTSGTLSKNVTTHSVLTENMVINSLESDEATLPLSAAQGKVLATDKQSKTDNNLSTIDKTVVGAINELLTKVQELETKNTELESRLAALEGTN